MIGGNANIVVLGRHQRKEKTDDELMQEIQMENELVAQQLMDRKHNLSESNGNVQKIMTLYLSLSNVANELTRGKLEIFFSSIMFAVILLAGIIIGVDTFPGLLDSATDRALNWFIFSMFALEFLLKTLAEGKKPYLYFVGEDRAWNIFDFAVLIFCVPNIPVANGKVSVIRVLTKMFRMARVVKLLRAIPALNVIIKGLMGGLKSIMYVLFLLFAFIYTYAVVGVIFFQAEDPFYFRSVGVGIMTMFRAMTFDNWDLNFYTNVYGCDQFNAGLYFSNVNMTDDSWQSIPFIYRCENTTGAYFAIVFWVTYIVFSGLILMALFIGVVTVNMQASLNEVRIDAEESHRKSRLQKKQQELEHMTKRQMMLLMSTKVAPTEVQATKTAPLLHTAKCGRLRWLLLSFYRRILLFFRVHLNQLSLDEELEMQRLLELHSLLEKAWNGNFVSRFESAQTRRKLQQERFVRELAIKTRAFIDSYFFGYFQVVFLFLAALLVGAEADNPGNSVYVELEYPVIAVFSMEAFIRLAGEEFNVRLYLSNTWNVFDCVIIIASSFLCKFCTTMRIFRLFRVMKLVRALPQLGIIVDAIIIAFSSIYYIGILIVLILYLFALVGMAAFSGNDPVNFGRIDNTMIMLFDYLTLDNWGQAMYINFYGCDVYPPPSGTGICSEPYAAGYLAFFFFGMLICLGSFTMLTLFIGVVTTAMEEATKAHRIRVEREKRLEAICAEKEISRKVLELYRRVFFMLDLDGSGTIEPEEIQIGLSSIGIRPSSKQLLRWVSEVDKNCDGTFDLAEFVAFMVMVKKKNLKVSFRQQMRSVIRDLRLEKRMSAKIDEKDLTIRRHNSLPRSTPPSDVTARDRDAKSNLTATEALPIDLDQEKGCALSDVAGHNDLPADCVVSRIPAHLNGYITPQDIEHGRLEGCDSVAEGEIDEIEEFPDDLIKADDDQAQGTNIGTGGIIALDDKSAASDSGDFLLTVPPPNNEMRPLVLWLGEKHLGPTSPNRPWLQRFDPSNGRISALTLRLTMQSRRPAQDRDPTIVIKPGNRHGGRSRNHSRVSPYMVDGPERKDEDGFITMADQNEDDFAGMALPPVGESGHEERMQRKIYQFYPDNVRHLYVAKTPRKKTAKQEERDSVVESWLSTATGRNPS